MLTETTAAGEYVAFPAWFAAKLHVPAVSKVNPRPETVQTAVVLDVIVGINPLEAVAERVNGDCARVNVAEGAKVIV